MTTYIQNKEVTDMNFNFDVQSIRKQFPACDINERGIPIAYLDGPGGTQVPKRVLDAMTEYLINDNANEDGNFKMCIRDRSLCPQPVPGLLPAADGSLSRR